MRKCRALGGTMVERGRGLEGLGIWRGLWRLESLGPSGRERDSGRVPLCQSPKSSEGVEERSRAVDN